MGVVRRKGIEPSRAHEKGRKKFCACPSRAELASARRLPQPFFLFLHFFAAFTFFIHLPHPLLTTSECL